MSLLTPAHTAATALLDALPAHEDFRAPEVADVARRLRERLSRDLLPRLDAAAPLLLVAIAGPNNVGKSSLFNTLAGAPLSPARPEGGLTKQCLAAVHPDAWTSLLLESLAARYELVEVEAGTHPGVDVPGPPGRLFLMRAPGLPGRLLLMDTPDFDSVFKDNRVAAEALLVTVDVVLFVVSRQTYQNAELVGFLRTSVGAGRPYVLIYNEATAEPTAREHLDTLVGQVGQPPVARYYAPHQPEVEKGAPLVTRPLERAPQLTALLGEETQAVELKRQALAATARDAVAEAELVAAATEEGARAPERVRSRLRHELQQLGERAALRSVPSDVVLAAFREALDAQSAFHRAVRVPFRALAAAVGAAGKGLRRAFTGPPPPSPPPTEATDRALRDGLRAIVERLSPEVAAWDGDERTRALLADALGPATLRALEGPLPLPELADARADEARFQAFCRELIGAELPRGLSGGVLQALTTLVYTVPAGAAAAVSMATGGLGHDVVIWAGSVLTTPLLERFVDSLGADIRERVVEAWATARGTTLAHAMEVHLFGTLLQELDVQVQARLYSAGRMREEAHALARALGGAAP
ncbi:MAG: 50S ribosome-binding GTPase [Myxococcaceae bacterium]|nr:50S ribosome-binding GTPase [Myxococcaceae bacterium]MCI0670201.1 50S ribosome-binding GTPase [Myxococcaceae bacterium]